MIDRDAAQTFVWLHARLIDRHRYHYHFERGGPGPVLAALRPYQNADGGFGHALEPDARGAESQPLPTYTALSILDEIGAGRDPLVARAVGYLAAVTAPDGGVPIALPGLRRDLQAPWLQPRTGAPAGGLLPTAGIAGVLHKHRVAHPWLAPATDFCWRAIAALERTHPYEVEAALRFLEHAPERRRAERAAERLGCLVREQRLVLPDPDARAEDHTAPGYGPGEVHTPLDYAPTPTGLARRWFSDAALARDLDALERGQGADGGWRFTWREWNAATTLAWRGVVTIRALTLLRAYGRLHDA
ncbi:MAG: FIG01124587: hypothetical protein [uncultured Gemmatimonadaceae bacterium]|uniref:Squalene cyclase C-terminal domain-containing protein n=1 Tax=uncultured Gemmatimonadaceae bacterium TaxID=246130 RepID=A0A6J4LAT9_9BACT|nr:MAG: FIG01124587: hypothetical protein [uncultured Gemmatimonadaceae bacterium]